MLKELVVNLTVFIMITLLSYLTVDEGEVGYTIIETTEDGLVENPLQTRTQFWKPHFPMLESDINQ